MVDKIAISDLLNSSVKDFSLYTIYSRAIPSLIDGFKPVHRKVFYSALGSSTSLSKTFSFAGAAILSSNYHHGSASMEDAVNKLAADYNNNVCMLKGEGSFGSRLVPEAAATRYTSVKFNKKEMDKWFSDSNLAPKQIDPENPEPKYYLPIIPWVLVNGISGIATGFATDILAHDPKDLAKACVKYLSGEEITEEDLKPSYPSYTGKIVREDDKWVSYGTYKLTTPTKLHITEVPIGFDMKSYIGYTTPKGIMRGVLNKLKLDGKIISYIDKCSDTFEFIVTLPRGHNLTDAKIITMFKLKRNLNENLTVIDEDGNLKIFESSIDILKGFCDFRYTMYAERYEKLILEALVRREWLMERGRFIMLVVNDKIKLKGKSSAILLDELIGLKFKHGSRLLKINIGSFCVDEILSLKSEIDLLDKDVIMWRNVNFKEQYLSELKEVSKDG